MDFTEEKRDARLYELAVLTVGEKEDMSFAPGIEVIRKEGPKSVPLGYPIKKHESAFLTVYIVKAIPEDAVMMEDMVRIKPAILRHILISSPIMTRRRDARLSRARLNSTDSASSSSAQRDGSGLVVDKADEMKAEKREEAKPFSPEVASNAALEAALETIQGANESR